MCRSSLVFLLSCILVASSSGCGTADASGPTGVGALAGTGGGVVQSAASGGSLSARGGTGGTREAPGGGGGVLTGEPSGGGAWASGGTTTASAGGTGGTAASAGGTGGTAASAGGTGGTAASAGGTGGTAASAGGTGGTAANAGGTGGTAANAGGTGGTTASAGGAGMPPVVVDQGALAPVTVHLAGDSTVTEKIAATSPGQEGWGMELGQYFISKVTINNQAIGGANVVTFKGGSRWSNIKSAMQQGDYVLIGFGTNDSGTGTRHVDVPEFTATLSAMLDEVRAGQAIPILFTPSALQIWVDGEPSNERHQPYCDAILGLGPTKDVQVVDLNARGIEHLRLIGREGAEDFYYEGDKAHFTQLGATQTAKFVTEELQRIQSPLAGYLKSTEQ